MSGTILVISDINKSDQDKIIEAIDNLVFLCEIEKPDWHMNNEQGEEIDSLWKRGQAKLKS